jgi:hypothetical protein
MDMNKKTVAICIIILLAVVMLPQNQDHPLAQEVKQEDYTVKPDSLPVNIKYTKYSTYNSYTRQYYLLRSYLERLEQEDGGTLRLSEGTYKITNTLYIPSNVTIILEDGVIIKKTAETGTTSLKSSKSIFQLAAPSKASEAGAYGGYSGETNINILGYGTAVIDLNYVTDSIGIMMGHNTNINILGITFLKMKGGHFIELDASQNVTIENNIFRYHKSSSTGSKEAINLDTPDLSTGGFHAVWTNYDCTPNKDILIQNNTFRDLERAIGTHKYTENKYHENIQILDNYIYNTDSDAIRILNWENPIVKGNYIELVANGGDNKRAILASGILHPVIMDNTFQKVSRPIQIMPWKNTGTGSQYAITYNEVSSKDITLMLKNKLISVKERFIRINKTYQVFNANTNKYYYKK